MKADAFNLGGTIVYVSELIVKGYRSLKDLSGDRSIKFKPGINVIVGKNNSGKSNIIKALDLVLGEKHPSYRELEDRDFHKLNNENSVNSMTIAVRLDGGLPDPSSLPNRDVKCYIIEDFTPTWDEDCIEKIKNAEKSQESMNYRLIIESSDERWIFFYAKKDSDEKRYGLVFRHNGTWFKIALPQELRHALITTAYVSSYRDPSQTLKITKYSWYGKLIHDIYYSGREKHKDEIEEIQNKYSEKIGEIFSETTEELRKRLSKAIFNCEFTFKPGQIHNRRRIQIDDIVHR